VQETERSGTLTWRNSKEISNAIIITKYFN
jgi:hypothetical protein